MRAIVLGVLALCAVTCSDVEELIECHQICDRYQECKTSGFDVNACRSRCEDRADRDAEYARRVNECDACLERRACGESDECFASRCPQIAE